MSDDFIFQAGDKVKCAFFGDEVFVLVDNNIYNTADYPLMLSKVGDQGMFTTDGRLHTSHTHPVLTLVERPKKKIKKKYWVASYKNVTRTLIASFLVGSEHEIKKIYGGEPDVQFHEIEREEEV